MPNIARLRHHCCLPRTFFPCGARAHAGAASLMLHVRRAEHAGRAWIWKVLHYMLDWQLKQLLAQQPWHQPIAWLDC